MARADSMPGSQQGALLRLGRLALEASDLSELLHRAAVIVAEALEVDFCKIMELLPGGESLLMRAGVGWREGVVGQVVVAAAAETHAGCTLATRAPVVIENLPEERRFPAPSILHDHNVTSGVSMVIPGAEPFGVLAVHTTSQRNFSADELVFLEAVVEVLGAAIHRHRKHEAIGHSEREFRRIFNNSPVGMVVVGSDDRFVRVNARVCELLGYTENELKQLTVYELLSDEESARVRALAGKLTRGEIPTLQVETYALRKSGEPVWLKLTAALAYDEHARPLHIVGMMEDLSQQRKCQQELCLARFSLERAQEAITWTASDGSIRDANDAMCSLLGYSIPEMLSLKLSDVEPGILARDWPNTWRELKTSGAATRESRLRRKDGSEIPVEISASYLEHDGVEFICTIARDITERKRIAAELDAREARYRALFENAAAIVLTMDLEENINSANWTAERILGYSSSELIGKNVAALCAPDEYEIFRHMTARKLELGGTTTYAIDMLAKDGRRVPMQITSSLIFENGTPVGVQGILIDISEQQQARETARRRQERFRALVEHAMDLIAVLTAEGEVLYASPSMQRVLGYTPEERIGRKAFEIIHPDDTSTVRNALAEIARSPGASNTLEFRVRHRNGSWRYLQSVVRNLLDNPAVAGIVANSRDITERIKSEKHLRESRATLQAAMASMTDTVCISDAKGKLIEFNEAFAAFFRFESRDQYCRDFSEYPKILDLFLPDGSLVPIDHWAVPRALRGETVTNAEHIIRWKETGETSAWSFSFAPIRDPDGKIVGSVVVGRDVTERKRTEETLRQNERRFRALVTASSQAIYWMSPDFGQLHHLVGHGFLADTDDPSRTWLDRYVPPDDQSEVLAVIEDAIRTQSTFQLEHRVIRADGSMGWTLSRAIPLRDAHGEISEWFGAATDITARKQAEEALRQSQTELRALAARLIGDEEEVHRHLARELHDDFGQRLTALGFDLSAFEADCPPDVPAHLKEKLRSVHTRLATLADDLRLLSHQLHPASLELLGLPVALRELCINASRRSNSQVRFIARNVPETLPQEVALCCYRVAQECLLNIAKHAQSEEVSVTLSGAGNSLRLAIKDNGVGFDPSALPEKGRLGLISIKERVRLAGGTLTLQSRPGWGTRVIVEVPVNWQAKALEADA